jgi:hypothetical protein
LYLRYEKAPIVGFEFGNKESSSHVGTYTITIKAKAENPDSKASPFCATILAPILKETIRSMKFTARIPVTASLLALLLITATGCNRLKARDQLTKGVQAFKNARYEEAVNHFNNQSPSIRTMKTRSFIWLRRIPIRSYRT